VLALYDRHPNLVVFPYNTSIGEMLRRPLEFTLTAPIAVVDHVRIPAKMTGFSAGT